MAEILKELARLRLPKDKFAVFGSGPLAVRGIREAKDIDLIMKKGLWSELVWTHPSKKDSILLEKNIRAYKDWSPAWETYPGADALIDSADVIDGIRFVKLEHVLAWKKARGEKKDLEDVQLIIEYLASGKA